MFKFFSNIFMITIFFIGLGAVTDTILKTAFQADNDCLFEKKIDNELKQIKVIRFEEKSDFQPSNFQSENALGGRDIVMLKIN